MRDREKRRAAQRALDIQSTLKFPLDTRLLDKRIILEAPAINPDLSDEAYIEKLRHFIKEDSFIIIPNPSYIEPPTPRVALFRVPRAISGIQRSLMRFLVELIAKTRLKSHVIKARGSEFHQWWFGVWCRYAMHAVISADSRNKKAQGPVLALLKLFDKVMGGKTRRFLYRLDPPVAKSMSSNHQYLNQYFTALQKREEEQLSIDWEREEKAKAGRRGRKRRQTAPKAKQLFLGRSFTGTLAALKATHSGASALRLGGAGNMLAVSWGEGTVWHRDSKDYGNHYTIITVLGRPAILHVAELGVSVPINPGDSVGFLAHKYLHKLEPKPVEDEEKAPRQIVFTCWTDKIAQMRMEDAGIWERYKADA